MAKDKNYEYHKQNDYPGERVAEKKRVADRKESADKRADARVAAKGRSDELKADNRVAKKGRMDGVLMDSQKKKSNDKASKIRRERNADDATGLFIIIGLIGIILVGLIWSFLIINDKSNEIDYLNSQLANCNSKLGGTNTQIFSETESTTNQPKVLYISPLTSEYPSNNDGNLPVNVVIEVIFSEEMDPLTINENTFMVDRIITENRGSEDEQYGSSPIEGEITYNNRKATFTSIKTFGPNEIYDNVFKVTITTDVKNVADDALQNFYIWSFTTGDGALY